MKRISLAILATAVGIGLAGSAVAQDKAKSGKAVKSVSGEATWKFGLKGHVEPVPFSVSPGGRYVVFTVSGFHRDRGPSRWAVLFDTKTGQQRNVAEMLKEDADNSYTNARYTFISPDGKYLAVLKVRYESDQGERSLRTIFSQWVITLADGKAKKLAESNAAMLGVWVGNRLAVSMFDLNQDNSSLPVKLFNPATGKSEELTLRGLIGSGTSDGKTVAALIDPNGPTRSISLQDMPDVLAVTMTLDGEILRKIGMGTDVKDPPIFSPDGKYVAFRQSRPSDDFPPPMCVAVMSVRGDESRKIENASFPVHVTDLQKVITLGDGTPDAKTSPVKLWDGDKSVTLVPDAQAAAVAAGKLYYVTGGPNEELVLHAAKIDDLKKSAGK